MSRTRAWAGVVVAASLVLGACSSGGEGSEPEAAAPTSAAPPSEPAHADDTPPRPRTPLRKGERIVDVTMPVAYTPSSEGKSTDDYRCFLLDPELESDAFVTGVDVVPGAREVVHHVIMFRVPPDQVTTAQEVDSQSSGEGWTCFGGSGLETVAGGGLDDAPWVGAWAPGGGERVLADGIGIPLERGSRLIMQVHYNLLAGSSADRSSVRLRLTDGSRRLDPLETMLLPAPVELPCRPDVEGALCDRENAVLDVMQRFGPRSGQVVAGLQLLCGDGSGLQAGPTQSCTRSIQEAATIRGVAGHMHLLGRKIRIELNPGRPDARTLLDIPVWDFDDQGTRSLRRPARVEPGDELRVTCTHEQDLRDLLPAFEGQPERYVVWGEGTTDEMCLGIVMVTRP